MNKRFLSLLLVVVMILQVTGITVFAEPEEVPLQEGAMVDMPKESAVETPSAEKSGCEFNFSTSQYVLSETDKSYEITVERKGNTEQEAEVIFKAVDVFGMYGEDYTILDSAGGELEKAEGISLSDEEQARYREAAASGAAEKNSGNDKENKSSVLKARDILLGSEADAEEAQAENEAQKSVEKLNSELASLEGVTGMLHFNAGEASKPVTVIPKDNNESGSDKIILMALMGASAGTVAPNATASVMIMDDEAYQAPVIEMAEGEITLDEGTPSKEIKIVRTSGGDYYTTVTASTYSGSAKAGEDFIEINAQEIEFGPGENEKMITVSASDFSEDSDFGVRIIADDSCVIGGADRTAVHICAPPQEDTANTSEKSGDSQGSLMADSETDEWDGLIGSQYYNQTDGIKYVYTDYWYSEGKYIDMDSREKIGKAITFRGQKNERIEIRANSTVPYANSIKIKFTTKRLDGSGDVIVYRESYGSKTEERRVKIGTASEIEFNGYLGSTDKIVIRSAYSSARFALTIDELQIGTKPYIFKGRDVKAVNTAGYIRLDSPSSQSLSKEVNIQPPACVFTDSEGRAAKGVYPGDWTVMVKSDSGFYTKYGLVLSAYGKKYYDGQIRTKKDLTGLVSGDHIYVPNETMSNDVTVHLETADNGKTYINTADKYKQPFASKTGTILHGNGYAASGRVITGYEVYAGKTDKNGGVTKQLVMEYTNKSDQSLLGLSDTDTGSGIDKEFFIPAIQQEGWTEIYIVPKTVEQTFTVKPNPGGNDWQYVFGEDGNRIPVPGTNDFKKEPLDFKGRVFLSNAEQTEINKPENTGKAAKEEGSGSIYADENGEIKLDGVTTGSSIRLNAISPFAPNGGYFTVWKNGTNMSDDDPNNVLPNEYASGMTQEEFDALYTPIYGNQLVYKVSQTNPKYYYSFEYFTKDDSRIIQKAAEGEKDTSIRKARIKKDTRNLLEYNGREDKASMKMLSCPGAGIAIGGTSAIADEDGYYTLDMAGLPKSSRMSAVVSVNNSEYVTHINTGGNTDIQLPCYDTFQPMSGPNGKYIEAYYPDGVNIGTGNIDSQDKELTIKTYVRHEINGMYITDAKFFVTDGDGNKVIDCNGTAGYTVEYKAPANGGTYGVATLTMNPQKDMLDDYHVYVQYTDQNSDDHMAMDTGYYFNIPMTLDTFIFGMFGSSGLESAVTDTFDVLGSPLFDMNMGSISGFNLTSGQFEPSSQVLTPEGKPKYVYNGSLYSYTLEGRTQENGSEFTGEEAQKASLTSFDKQNVRGGDKVVESGGDKVAEGGGDKVVEGDGGKDNKKSAYEVANKKIKNDPLMETIEKSNSGEKGDSGADKATAPDAPKGVNLSNQKSSAVKTKKTYTYELTPEINFKLLISNRYKTGENGKKEKVYCFEALTIGIGVDFDAGVRADIDFPIGISVILKANLSGSVSMVYYMKTKYSEDDPYWQSYVEYSPGTFDMFGISAEGGMTRQGYVALNPAISLSASVKVAIVSVTVSADFVFDMDFTFGDSGGDTHGDLYYSINVSIELLSFSIYDKNISTNKNNPWYLFGNKDDLPNPMETIEEVKPQSISDVQLMLADAFSGGKEKVEQADRSYLDKRSGWKGEERETVSLFSDSFDEDNPIDALLQNGVRPGGQMASAMIGLDKMMVVYTDDAPERDANDRNCVYYTCTTDNGGWTEPQAIEDDGTYDDAPVIYDMGDQLFVAWETADKTFAGEDDSLKTVSSMLNSMNVHGAFFDKASSTFGEIEEITKTTEEDNAGDADITVSVTEDGSMRVTYTKTQYVTEAGSAEELIKAESTVAYREYDNGSWSGEYDAAEQNIITQSGADAAGFTEQWYGQRFADTRIKGSWQFITDIEGFINESFHNLAYIADADNSYETADDRRVFITLPDYDLPICLTPECGAYDDLKFCYTGSEIFLMFKTDKIKTFDDEGNDKNLGGIAYINLSDLFEKTDYNIVENADSGYYEVQPLIADDMTGGSILYRPDSVISMEGTVQDYEVFRDNGGRMYVMWTESVLNDSGLSDVQIYSVVYNGAYEDGEDDRAVSGSESSPWGVPVLMTSYKGNYTSFTAQNVLGDSVVFAAKRNSGDKESQLVFHMRMPEPVLNINGNIMDTKYAHEGEQVILSACITNIGLKAVKTQEVSGENNTWKAVSGNYTVTFEKFEGGELKEVLGSYQVSGLWNSGDSVFSDCVWTPETIEDNTDISIKLTDDDSGELLYGYTFPIRKAADFDEGQIEINTIDKNSALLTGNLSNNGNMPAEVTAKVYLIDKSGNKSEVVHEELGEIKSLETYNMEIIVPVEEKYQEIKNGEGNFTAVLELKQKDSEDDEVFYSLEIPGSVMYSEDAIKDISEVERFNISKDSIRLKKNAAVQLESEILPQSAAYKNKVKYESSDEGIVRVTADGMLTAVSDGSAVVTAYAIPIMEYAEILPDGSTKAGDMRDSIPDSLIKTKEINVNVSGSSGGGGLLSGKATPAPTGSPKPTDAPAATSTPSSDKWFDDVPENTWYYEPVKYVFDRGLMTGVEEKKFLPETNITRAMLVTILYRNEGKPDMDDMIWGYPFADVNAESWYGTAVYWAKKNGIVKGYSDEEFAPDKPISREEFAAIMKRYADFKSIKTNKMSDLTIFEDSNIISGWAKNSMEWAVGYGLIFGRENNMIDPLGKTTRAEAAAILQRFIENSK